MVSYVDASERPLKSVSILCFVFLIGGFAPGAVAQTEIGTPVNNLALGIVPPQNPALGHPIRVIVFLKNVGKAPIESLGAAFPVTFRVLDASGRPVRYLGYTHCQFPNDTLYVPLQHTIEPAGVRWEPFHPDLACYDFDRGKRYTITASAPVYAEDNQTMLETLTSNTIEMTVH